jgi:hypothetical protein
MKIRIEIEEKGMKSSHEFESEALDRETLRDRIVEFLSASNVFSEKEASMPAYEAGRTLMDSLERFIRFEFPDAWFTSQELRERYETVADDIKLSTVSTYLSRMYHDQQLDRRGNRNNRQYRLVPREMQDIPASSPYQAKKRSAEGRW